MKKFLLCTLSIFILLQSLFSISINKATAQTQITQTATTFATNRGDYACILSDDAFFYSAPDEKRALFLLPKTYYVKILDYQADYCKVEYLYDDLNVRKIIGYAKTNDLTFVDYTPKRPYLYYVFDVRYEIGDTQINDSSFLTEITVTCGYYGDFHLGATTYCYVLRGDTFGYVPKPPSLSYEENYEYADYIAQQTPPEPPAQSAAPTDNSSPLQIGILITLCLLVPILTAVILKHPKQAYDYETDEAFE